MTAARCRAGAAAAHRRQVRGRGLHRVPGHRARVRGHHGDAAGAHRARAGGAGPGRARAPGSAGPGAGGPAGHMSELLAIGISHKTAPVEVRERLALPEARAGEFLRDLRGSCRRPRGGGDLHLQPHRAVPGRRRPGRGREHGAGDARQSGRNPSHGAGGGDLLPPQLRGRPAPLSRHRGSGVDDRGRGGDPGSGQARLRGRAGPGRRWAR